MPKSAWLAAYATATLAFALDPQRAITQFVHTSWTEKDGAPNNVRALAQTKDGYLWIGTTAGLFRFDGVRFTAFEAPPGEALPATRVRGLLATLDGAIWIVWLAGAVSRLQNGHLASYSEQDGLPATSALVESDDGTLIAATANGLSRLERGRWKDATKEWNFPGKQARQLYFDKDGTLWVASENNVMYLRRGQGRFIDTGIALQVFYDFVKGPDGEIWVSEVERSAHTIGRAGDGTRDTEVRVGATWVLFDRDGSLWVASLGDGLRRVPYPDRIRGKQIAQFGAEAERFTAKDGLSSPMVTTIMEDREGNIWCGTTNGLDRFRQGAFLAVEVPQPDILRGLVATKNGDLWVFSPSEAIRVSPLGSKELVGSYEILGLCEDESGGLWAQPPAHKEVVLMHRFRQGRFAPVPLPGNPRLRDVSTIACDHAGGLWFFDQDRGLFRLSDGGLAKIADSADPTYRYPVLYTDRERRVWLGQRDSIEMFDHGSQRRFDARDGVEVKLIRAFAEDKAGSVWIAGDGGLAQFDHDHFRSLSRSNGLPAQSFTGLVEDDNGYWWIVFDAGVLRIGAKELDRALGDSAYRVPYELFNLLDGLPAKPAVLRAPVLAKTGDGRIWVATANGIAYVDPRRIPRNPLPPPVCVESLKVNGKETTPVDGLVLSAGSNDLEIDYTALSLTIPERVRFKYKLEGHDSEWRDVGGRRQAYYGGLPPKDYRFRVIAANESGVWNEAGASFGFSIAPAYYQTRWFQALCAAAFLALLWGLYRFRLHQIAERFNTRMEARVDERTRIARELHDTLLQSFQALMIHFQAVDNLLPPGKGKDALEKVLDRADRALVEGRNAIQNIRSSTTVTNELSHAVTALGEELAGSHDGETGPATFRVSVEGTPRDLRPILRDDIYRIAREALQNAFRHAQASQIEADITYGDSLLRLRVRDDGKGIDPKHLHAGRDGHWGLPGMRERAQQIGAQFEMWSEVGAGTEVELRIPGSIVYVKARGRGGLRLFRKKKEGSNER